MGYLFLAALGGFLIYLAMRWFASAEPARLLFVAKTLAVSIVAVVAGLLIFTGRLGSLYMLGMLAAPAAIAWYRRWKAASAGFDDAGARRYGGRSQAESDWLRMELDLRSERMDGIVKQGAFAGRRLSGLDEDELLSLFRACQADEDSARLLEAYLVRRLGPERWARARAGSGGGARTGGAAAMSREEALEILGLEAGASDDDIRAAHRRLMAQLHPDKGGSTYLAAKINQAREVLLGH